MILWVVVWIGVAAHIWVVVAWLWDRHLIKHHSISNFGYLYGKDEHCHCWKKWLRVSRK